MTRPLAVLAAVLMFVVAGCSSSSSGGDNAKSDKVEILIAQTNNLPAAARFTDGALSIHYAVRAENRSAEPITLKRVNVQSVSEGGYYVAPQSKPYDATIAPGQRQEVELWVSASPGRSVVGNNGPVTLRVTCEFESVSGDKFQQVVMRRVNERADITGAQ
jgi:hypothetical protein